MNTIRITPTDEAHWLKLRTEDITSTEIAALFGISPYMTEFELWHHKKSGEVNQIEGNERMVWGTRLQDTIARGVADDLGLDVRRLNQYMRITTISDTGPVVRIGSSFDFEIVNHDDGPGVMEIKNVDGLVFRDGWMVDEDGNVEAPPHIELQVQHQMLVSHRKWCLIVALVGGNRVVTIRREFDPQIGESIVNKCIDFWDSIDENKEPTPDYTRDADTIKRIYNHSEPGKVYDGAGNDHIAALCMAYHAAGQDEKEAKARKDAAKAELLSIIGDAEKCITDVGSVSAGVVSAADISYTREAYRNFRFTMKKGLKQQLAESAA